MMEKTKYVYRVSFEAFYKGSSKRKFEYEYIVVTDKGLQEAIQGAATCVPEFIECNGSWELRSWDVTEAKRLLCIDKAI
jgi:hypothetical protein